MAYEGNDEARSQTVPSSKGGDRIHPPLHMFFGFPISLPSYTLEQKSLRFSSTTSLHCIHKKGIKPDVEVKDNMKTKADEQLNKAISILQKK